MILKDKFEFQCRGQIKVKGKGDMTTYFLIGRKPPGTFSQSSPRMSFGTLPYPPSNFSSGTPVLPRPSSRDSASDPMAGGQSFIFFRRCPFSILFVT